MAERFHHDAWVYAEYEQQRCGGVPEIVKANTRVARLSEHVVKHP
ncbi:MAG TPA: hypothetical protein VFT39_06565 [Vicinamibacterales bacterium]|nr:hypothetical protein [Vicinamibacterales bacterium]